MHAKIGHGKKGTKQEALFVDEKTAWRIFCSTGKIDDYMRYSQIKSENAAGMPAAVNVLRNTTNANQDGWNYHQGTNGGGK